MTMNSSGSLDRLRHEKRTIEDAGVTCRCGPHVGSMDASRRRTEETHR